MSLYYVIFVLTLFACVSIHDAAPWSRDRSRDLELADKRGGIPSRFRGNSFHHSLHPIIQQRAARTPTNDDVTEEDESHQRRHNLVSKDYLFTILGMRPHYHNEPYRYNHDKYNNYYYYYENDGVDDYNYDYYNYDYDEDDEDEDVRKAGEEDSEEDGEEDDEGDDEGDSEEDGEEDDEGDDEGDSEEDGEEEDEGDDEGDSEEDGEEEDEGDDGEEAGRRKIRTADGGGKKATLKENEIKYHLAARSDSKRRTPTARSSESSRHLSSRDYLGLLGMGTGHGSSNNPYNHDHYNSHYYYSDHDGGGYGDHNYDDYNYDYYEYDDNYWKREAGQQKMRTAAVKRKTPTSTFTDLENELENLKDSQGRTPTVERSRFLQAIKRYMESSQFNNDVIRK